MNLVNIRDMAKKWDLSEQTVRNYCARMLIPGAVRDGRTWWVPEDSLQPQRRGRYPLSADPLLISLRNEMVDGELDGIYKEMQILFAGASSRMDQVDITDQQVRDLFETRTITMDGTYNVDDLFRISNHFECFDLILDRIEQQITEKLLLELYQLLHRGCSDEGGHKTLHAKSKENSIVSEAARKQLREVLGWYTSLPVQDVEDLLDFFVRLDQIKPFKQHNEQIFRLILFKECLRYHYVPIIFNETLKDRCEQGIHQWNQNKEYLTSAASEGQKDVSSLIEKFGISYPLPM